MRVYRSTCQLCVPTHTRARATSLPLLHPTTLPRSCAAYVALRFRAVGVNGSRRDWPSLLAGPLHATRGDAAAAVATARATTAEDGILRVVRQVVTDSPGGELLTVVTQPNVLVGDNMICSDTLFFYAVPPPPRTDLPSPPAPPPMGGVTPASGASPPGPHEEGAAVSPAAAQSVIGRLERWADETMRSDVGSGSSFVLGVGAPKVGKSAFLSLVPCVLQLRRACAGARPAIFFEHLFAEGASPAECMRGLVSEFHYFQIQHDLAPPGSIVASGLLAEPFIAFQTLVPFVAQRLAEKGLGPLVVLLDECQAPLVNRGATDPERATFRQQRTAYMAALKHVIQVCKGAHFVCAGSGMVAFIDMLRSMPTGGFDMFANAYVVRMGDTLPQTVALQVAEDLVALARFEGGFADATLPQRIVAALAHPMLSVRTALIADVLRRYRFMDPSAEERSLPACIEDCVSKMERDMRSDTLTSLDGVDSAGLDALRALADDVNWMCGSNAPPSFSGVSKPGGVSFPPPPRCNAW